MRRTNLLCMPPYFAIAQQRQTLTASLYVLSAVTRCIHTCCTTHATPYARNGVKCFFCCCCPARRISLEDGSPIQISLLIGVLLCISVAFAPSCQNRLQGNHRRSRWWKWIWSVGEQHWFMPAVCQHSEPHPRQYRPSQCSCWPSLQW